MSKRGRARIQIITTSCERCGKPLATTNRSIHGLDRLKAQYGIICEGCITKEEQHDMLQAMGQAIANRSSGQ